MLKDESDHEKNEFKPNFIDLFCGAGGLSCGLKEAGFNVLAGIDNERHSIKTFGNMHPGALAIKKDLKEADPAYIEKEINNDDVFLIAGGPPCQGFSLANQQQKIEKFIEDPRNILYKEFVRFVDYFKPEYFLMENVTRIKKFSEQIKKDFNRIGYAVDFDIFNAKNFQIPQNRKRAFFIGTKSNGNILKNRGQILRNIFEKIHSKESEKVIPLKSTFWGLRELTPLPEKNMTNSEIEEHGFTVDRIINTEEEPPEYILKINKGELPEKIYNHKARYQNERDKEIFKRLPPGGNSNHPSIQDINPYKDRNDVFKDKFYKLPPDEPCKTITSHMQYDCHMYIHPYEDRGLTPREAARVQSFPDDYRFFGPFTRWYNQIGNAVPPLLGRAIGESIKETHFKLEGDV